MNIQKYDVVKFDSYRSYIVADLIKYDDRDFYYLCDEDDPRSTLFCELKDDRFIKVKEDVRKALLIEVSKKVFQAKGLFQ